MKQLVKHMGYLVVSGTILIAAACGNGRSENTATVDTSAMAPASDGGINEQTGSITAQAPTAADTFSTGTSAMNAPNQTDGAFVSDVLAGNMAEIAAHKAAVSRAENKTVKMHAQHMLTDHSKLGGDLKAYARKKSYSIPADMPADKKAAMDAMNASKGAAWDKAYVDDQIKVHQETIAKFEAAEKTVVDPELKSMVTAALPTLRSHLQMMQELQSTLK